MARSWYRRARARRRLDYTPIRQCDLATLNVDHCPVRQGHGTFWKFELTLGRNLELPVLERRAGPNTVASRPDAGRRRFLTAVQRRHETIDSSPDGEPDYGNCNPGFQIQLTTPMDRMNRFSARLFCNPNLKKSCGLSLVPQRFNRVKACGTSGRVYPEEKAYCCGHGQGQQRHVCRQNRGERIVAQCASIYDYR